jgi:hypothetical protein
LLARAERIGKTLPANAKDAYYELVLHPIEAASNLNDLYVTVARNRMYAQQGRASTNDLADRARKLFDRDAEISLYFNTQLAGGKWSHMMDQTHIGYTYWQEPPRNTMPRVDVIQLPRNADMGVAVVEQNRLPVTGRGGFPGGGSPPGGFGGRGGEVALPTFDPYQRQTFHVDVYNKGQTSFEFDAQTGESWVMVTPNRGTVSKEQRVAVSVDWTRAPAGEHKVPITFTGPNNTRSVVQAVVFNPATPTRDSFRGFIEGNGYVSIEAEHYTGAAGGSNGEIRWQRIPDLGRTLSGMAPMPVTARPQTPGDIVSPRLEYPVFLFDSGGMKVNVYLSPTLNFSGSKDGLRYAISFDNDAPQIVNVHADSSNRAWEKIVADNIILSTTTHTLAKPGRHVLKFWMVDPGIVLQKLVIEARPVAPTYLGPPESYYNKTAASTNSRSSAPRRMTMSTDSRSSAPLASLALRKSGARRMTEAAAKPQ